MEKLLGMEIVTAANMIKRVTFNDLDDENDRDRPTKTQHWFLAEIWHSGGCLYQKDLEKKFKIQRSTIAEILKSMEKKDLILRVTSQSDKRSKKIELTKKAIAICQKEDQMIKKTEERLIRGLSKDELNTFYAILYKVLGNITNKEEDL